MELAKRIEALTLELTGVLGVVGSPEENNVVNKVFDKFMEMDYFKNNPENLKYVDVIDDTIGRKSVLATIKGKKDSKKTIVLIGHTDTVGISDYGDIKEFATKPFELMEKLKNVTIPEEARHDLESGDYILAEASSI